MKKNENKNMLNLPILVENFQIGRIINEVIQEKNIRKDEIQVKMGAPNTKLKNMLLSNSMCASVLLKWSKVLRYDFFRLYSTHLMYHHRISNTCSTKPEALEIKEEGIGKYGYSNEMIQSVVDKVKNKELNSSQVLAYFGIPKTTFYHWLTKNPLEKKCIDTAIPIGNIIQAEVYQMDISLHELSDKMFMPEKTLLHFFNSKSIELSMLYKWSCVMKINLFSIYSEYLLENVHAIDLETMTHSYKHHHIKKFIHENKLQRDLSNSDQRKIP